MKEKREVKMCSCKDWGIGNPQVNGAFVNSVLHHGVEFKGETFKYCPWCGKSLYFKDTVTAFKERLARGELNFLKIYLKSGEKLEDLPACVVYIEEKRLK